MIAGECRQAHLDEIGKTAWLQHQERGNGDTCLTDLCKCGRADRPGVTVGLVIEIGCLHVGLMEGDLEITSCVQGA